MQWHMHYLACQVTFACAEQASLSSSIGSLSRPYACPAALATVMLSAWLSRLYSPMH